MLKRFLGASVLLVCSVSVIAQSTPPQSTPPADSNPSPVRRAHLGNPGPCFQRAGIDRSVVEQLMSLHREAHSQVQTVCSNTSLTPQQKHEQVQQIHQQTHQKIEQLITPEQEKTLMACRQQRQGENHPGGQLAMGGGCGDWGHGGARRGAPNGQDSSGSGNPPPSAQSSPEN